MAAGVGAAASAQDATEATGAANTAILDVLPFDDATDAYNGTRGLLATLVGPIADPDGSAVYDPARFGFLQGALLGLLPGDFHSIRHTTSAHHPLLIWRKRAEPTVRLQLPVDDQQGSQQQEETALRSSSMARPRVPPYHVGKSFPAVEHHQKGDRLAG
jgi:hypothetical protein